MKNFVNALLVCSAMVIGATAAKADDGSAAWIAKCIKDAEGGANSAAIIKNYCECMNGEMSTDEKLSVHAWAESTAEGKAADVKCEKSSGWK